MPAVVPLDLHANAPEQCQKSHGNRQPIQAMVVTRQQAAVSDQNRDSPSMAYSSREATRLKHPCVEHEDHDGPCEHANLPGTEQEEGWNTHQPRVDPQRGGIRTNETLGGKSPSRPTTRRQGPSTRSTCFGQASSTTYAFNVRGRQLICTYPGYTVRCSSNTGDRHQTVG